VQADVYLGSAAPSSGTTRIEVVGFERREVELVEGFNEIGGFAETDPVTKSWDWVSYAEPSASGVRL
jgi:hypothetical protein